MLEMEDSSDEELDDDPKDDGATTTEELVDDGYEEEESDEEMPTDQAELVKRIKQLKEVWCLLYLVLNTAVG